MNITYFGTLNTNDGYGRACGLNMRSLLSQGVELYVQPCGDWNSADFQEVAHLRHKPRIPTRAGIVHLWSPLRWSRAETAVNTPFKIGYTMVEGTRAPKWFIDALDFVDCVAVPSRHSKEVIESSGCRVPVFIVPHGGMEYDYWYGNLRNPHLFTVGHHGTLTKRKGTEILLSAFRRAFGAGEKEVRLEIKVRGPYEWANDDKRITFHCGEWSTSQVRNWLQSIDLYAFPTRGEGFGLTPVEAALCGCRVACTDWSGCRDYIKALDILPIPVKQLTSIAHDWPDNPADWGEWGLPDEEALIEILRQEYRNKREGKRSQPLSTYPYTLDLPGKRFLELLQGA